jgi:hypothetical protein
MAHWQDDEQIRKSFFATFNKLCRMHSEHPLAQDRDALRQQAQGCEHLSDYPGTPGDLLNAVRAILTTPVEQSTDNPTEATMDDNFEVTAGSIQGVMTEAGFSINFFWCDDTGAERQFTMRAVDWRRGLDELPQFENGLRALGYLPKAEWAQRHPAAEAPRSTAPAPRQTTPGLDSDTQKSADIVQVIMHSKPGGKVSFDLMPLVNGSVGRFKFVTIYDPKPLEAVGYNTGAWQAETPYAVNLRAVATRGKMFRAATASQPAGYYWDLVSLERN